MKPRNYFIVSMIIFILAGALHLIRSIMKWEMVIEGFIVPLWVSWLAVAILAYVIWQGLDLLRKN